MVRKLSLATLFMFSCVSHAVESVEHEKREAVAACISGSTLASPSALVTPAVFSGNDTVVAVLIRGIKPPPAMKKQVGAELCLYDVQAKSIRLANWDSITYSRNPTRPSVPDTNM